MGDRVSREKRSEVMSKVRAKGTKPEKQVALLLTSEGLTGFVEQPKDIKGHPDFAFLKVKVLIFVDSCFWHGCVLHLRMPATNLDYWHDKIERNRHRDRYIRKELRADGWQVIRIWEHELPDTPSLKAKLTHLKKLLTTEG